MYGKRFVFAFEHFIGQVDEFDVEFQSQPLAPLCKPVKKSGIVSFKPDRNDIAEKRKIYSKMHENVVFINMTDGIDAAKLEAIIYKIINYKFSGQIVTCVPEKLRAKMKSLN